MSALPQTPAVDFDLSAIDIPPVATALSVMKNEILNASLSLSNIKDASVNLENIIRTSIFLDQSVQEESSVLKKSANNLEVAIFEIQEMISSLEGVLRKSKALVPPILSTADDISSAFHMAVNCPVINWALAETILERYLFLWTEELATVDNVINKSVLRNTTWLMNGFDTNMVKLMGGGDCWRLRKPLEVLSKLIDNDRDCDIVVSAEFFDSLASIISHPMRSSLDDEEMKWAYLITSNQDKVIDHGISRLINSYLYSKKGKTSIAYNLLKILSALVLKDSTSVNSYYLSIVPNIPQALINILCEEKENADIIEICLALVYRNFSFHREILSENSYENITVLGENYIRCGICKALIPIIDMYMSHVSKLKNALEIISCIINYNMYTDDQHKYTRLFADAGLLQILVVAFNSRYISAEIPALVKILCTGDEDVTEEFHKLGIPKRSYFFGKQ